MTWILTSNLVDGLPLLIEIENRLSSRIEPMVQAVGLIQKGRNVPTVQ